MKKILYLLLLSIIFLSSASVSLAAKGIGQECNKSTFDIFTECDSGDCETSNIKNDGGGYKSYCDCNGSDDCSIYGPEKDKNKWSCVNGKNDATDHDIDVCVFNEGKSDEKKVYPLDADLKPTKAFGGFNSNVADVALLNEIKTFKPNDMIKIPNLTFTDVENNVDAQGYLNLPWIGQLIKAIYNWGMVVVSIIAAIMIIMTATKIIVGGGGATAEGYKRIGQIVIGLFIAWGSYAILYNINPALVEFKALRVKYIEPQYIEDESNAEFTEESLNEGSGKSIKDLIGSRNTSYDACSIDAAQDAAKKLHDAMICVGPCHCAWTAGRFLKYLGCPVPTRIEGIVDLQAASLGQEGWIYMPVEGADIKKLPLGMFFGGSKGKSFQHAGVSVGKGKQFQSSTGAQFKRVSKGTGGTCPPLWADSVANPSACSVCAKLTGEGPETQHFGSKSCTSNQGWTFDTIDPGFWGKYWKGVMIPPGQKGLEITIPEPKPKVNCCFIKAGHTYNFNISSDLCTLVQSNNKPCQ